MYISFAGFARTAIVVAVSALALTPFAAEAQGDTLPSRVATSVGEPIWSGGMTAVIGQPVGAFREYVAEGYGVAMHGLARLRRQRVFAARLDAGYLNYGNETIRMPLGTAPGGGRIGLNVKTSNNIFWMGAGPQVMVPRGPVRPYANATIGFSHFSTMSSVSGRRSDDMPFAYDTNHDDSQFSWGTGGGLAIPMFLSAQTQVLLDVGVRYHNNGREVRYLREGGIRDLPNGDVELNVIRSRADLLTWHVGASLKRR